MSEDYEKGRNGEYMQNSYGNQEYERGQSDARIEKAHTDWYNSQSSQPDYSSYSGGSGYSSASLSPAATMMLLKGIGVLFVMGLALLAIVVGFFSYTSYVHSEAQAAKLAKAQAARVARQQKLIDNRKPFTFDGYTLYSGPANAKYLSFRITNSQGQVIYRQPAWMNDKVVSESQPMANIANHTYLHPGQIHFDIMGYGQGRQGKIYMQFISISRAGKVTWASPYSEPRKPQYAFNPNAHVYMIPPITYHPPKPVHWDAAFVMKILEVCVKKYL